MKYRTKLYLAFGGLVLGTVLLLEGFSYIESKKKFIQMVRSQVIGIAATAATLVDKNDVQSVKEQLNDKTENFASLVHQLRAIRDANRHLYTYVQDIYLIEPNPHYPDQVIIVADASQQDNYAPPGTAYPEGVNIGILKHLNEPFSPHSIVEDRWGRFLPGYAPIYSESGQYLATLGVNLSVHFVYHTLFRLTWVSFVAMGIALLAGLTVASILASGVARSLKGIIEGVLNIGNGQFQTRIEIQSKDEFSELASSINMMALELQERDRLKLSFIRYVSKDVMEKISRSGKMPALGGEKRKITVLFSDIRNFTRLAETLSPEQVISLISDFMTVMINLVFAKNGTFDKFVGDGIMAEFGAPLEDLDQERHAVETAIAMQLELQKLNEKWTAQGFPHVSMVIGIHTGHGVVGNIGSEKRMEYTAVGDTVNTATRIEEAAKKLETSILISETTWIPIRNRFVSKDLGPLYLKGKTKAIKVYSIEIPKEG